MNRKLFLRAFLISFFLCVTEIWASIGYNVTKPFVGKWSFWSDYCYCEMELNLYDTPMNECYGQYRDFCGDTEMEYSIVKVLSIQNNVANVIVKSVFGRNKAILEYDSITGKLTFKIQDYSPIVFNHQDKYGFVIVNGTNKINIYSAPVSGIRLLEANSGQSFRFLDIEDGWFKVELSEEDKRIGYISPLYAHYLKDNNIPENAFTKDYSNKETSIMFNKINNQIIMVKETIRPLQDGSFLPAIVESYLGKIKGNSIIFTYFKSGYTDKPNINEMSKIEPLYIYYRGETGEFNSIDSGTFILEGKEYINWEGIY